MLFYIILLNMILDYIVSWSVTQYFKIDFLQRDDTARQLEICQSALQGIKKEAKDIEESWGSKVSTLTSDRYRISQLLFLHFSDI